MSCVVRGCVNRSGQKALLCSACWNKIPAHLQADIRKGTEKGQHTLRVHPSREWLSAIIKHVGDVKNLVVRVDAHTNKISRKVQEAPEPLPV